jgi:hypothetical protein
MACRAWDEFWDRQVPDAQARRERNAEDKRQQSPDQLPG